MSDWLFGKDVVGIGLDDMSDATDDELACARQGGEDSGTYSGAKAHKKHKKKKERRDEPSTFGESYVQVTTTTDTSAFGNVPAAVTKSTSKRRASKGDRDSTLKFQCSLNGDSGEESAMTHTDVDDTSVVPSTLKSSHPWEARGLSPVSESPLEESGTLAQPAKKEKKESSRKRRTSYVNSDGEAITTGPGRGAESGTESSNPNARTQRHSSKPPTSDKRRHPLSVDDAGLGASDGWHASGAEDGALPMSSTSWNSSDVHQGSFETLSVGGGRGAKESGKAAGRRKERRSSRTHERSLTESADEGYPQSNVGPLPPLGAGPPMHSPIHQSLDAPDIVAGHPQQHLSFNTTNGGRNADLMGTLSNTMGRSLASLGALPPITHHPLLSPKSRGAGKKHFMD